MKCAVILNPVSGRGRSLKLLPRVVDWTAKKNIEFELFTTTSPGDGVRLGELCRFRQFDRVVAIGGDGTINEVGSALAGSDIVLGVIPGGSGNDFYKMLGNDKNLKTGLKTAFSGKSHDIDIGLFNERPFFNTVGIGFDAEVALRASQSTGMSGMMVYLLAVFRTFRKFQPVDLEIELDRIKISTKATLICIGNGRSSGGGFYLTPHAEFDDGFFDVCLIEELPKISIFRYLPKTLNGSHVRLPGVKVYRCKKIAVSSCRELPVHIDGEPLTEPIKRAEFTMDTRKLRVAVAG